MPLRTRRQSALRAGNLLAHVADEAHELFGLVGIGEILCKSVGIVLFLENLEQELVCALEVVCGVSEADIVLAVGSINHKVGNAVGLC